MHVHNRQKSKSTLLTIINQLSRLNYISGLTTEGSKSVVQVRHDIKNRHDYRDECFNAAVNSRGQPSGPTALGSTRHYERFYLRDVECFNKFLNRIP